jgi:hypothetical protein
MDNPVSDDIWFPEPFWKGRLYEMAYENQYVHIHFSEFEYLDIKIAREKQKQFWRKTYGFDR